MNGQLKILTCGSVDDGKSTLIGHLLYSSKLLYTDQIKALELDSKMRKNNSLDYSMLLDGLDEEREQGITIDVAYRYFKTPKRSFIVLDTPGHEEYTRNMAVGASQADLAILLIDVTKGIQNQTKRHLKICMMMGIHDYIVVINKMDLVNYNEKPYKKVEKELFSIFQNYSYNSLKTIPISATRGDNITKHSKLMKWYKGNTLIKELETIDINKYSNASFIIPIQRVCRPNQFFRGFQGKAVSGSIGVGDHIICLPSKETANIKEIYNLNKKVKTITKGSSITITLDKEIDVSRGCVLTNDEKVKVSNKIDVEMLWMDEDPLKLNNAYYLKIGTAETLCYIRKINYKIDIDSNTKKRTNLNSINKNEIINCNIEILEKVPMTEFAYNKELGSLILINRLTNATSSCATIKKIYEQNNIFHHNTAVTTEDRKNSLGQKPITVWFTGLSCSGKSTIANELDKILTSKGYHTMLLDGDNVRLGLNSDLSFSDKDRIENIRRISEVAKLMNDAGLICITSFISPLEINRAMARKIIGNKFVLVYINTDLEECERRDKKGLYAKARKGVIKNFTGINSIYEEPQNADLILYNNDYKECAEKVYKRISEVIKWN